MTRQDRYIHDPSLQQLMGDDEIGNLIKELRKLKIREASIIARLQAANERRGVPDEIGANATGLARGDRVRVTNAVRRPASWPEKVAWDEKQAKRGTVTQVTTDRVYFVTDNGIKTWRAPRNLRKLEIS
jgi:hypothetical protein